ncbi:MAG TPA: NnrS family protein, partial [Anaeromyxobacteraceae bacterium]|nr:NnrS family protein [Anaeromyxobacteraceae bacterium]
MRTAPASHGHRWRREPYRVLFPLGAALGIFAVLPFAWRSASGASLALFHSVAQIQGFLTCFVAGFLMTLVPRHTRTTPAAGWEVVAAAVLPTVAVLAAWMGDPTAASWLWLALLFVVMGFTASRLRARPASLRL